LCDGTAYSRATYSVLFSVIGTYYGSGDGSTTFNVPDLRSRVPVGSGQGVGLTNRPLGSSGGQETHLLTTAEMPSHTHTDSGHTHTDSGHSHGPGAATYFMETNGAAGTGLTGGSGIIYLESTVTATASANISTSTANLQNTGGNGAHNNMQPFLSVNYIIKT
jgi:microcystin-dependent protein